ncbi:MAG: iron-containing alcohol dehydrogenase [Gammaproteobacteria bacterium]
MTQIGRYTPAPAQEVIYGKPTAEALGEEIERRKVSRIVFVTNTSLSHPDGLGEVVKAPMGSLCVASVSGIGAHSPREDVIRLTTTLRDSDADMVVALGGGSVCDATKAACLALANGVKVAADIDNIRVPQPVAAATLPYVSIPTTLSAGEYTAYAGVTDERIPRKEVLWDLSMAPDVVILDSAMTVATPPRLFFGTGIRAVDHAVETWCSINVTPLTEATSLHALRILPQALARAKSDPQDLDNRLNCLIGAWLSVQGVATGVDLGASHGIGHVLGGTAGMPHGETSCVMLPHVLRYNLLVNGERQAALAQAMGDPNTPAADQIQTLVRDLDLPGRLRDCDVPKELLPTIAEESMHDMWIPTNPRSISGPEDVMPLLDAAW